MMSSKDSGTSDGQAMKERIEADRGGSEHDLDSIVLTSVFSFVDRVRSIRLPDPLPDVDYRRRNSLGTVVGGTAAAGILGGIYNGCRGAIRLRPIIPYFNHGVVAYAAFAFPLLTFREIFYYSLVKVRSNNERRKQLKESKMIAQVNSAQQDMPQRIKYDPWRTIDSDEFTASCISGSIIGSLIMARDAILRGMNMEMRVLRGIQGGVLLGLGVGCGQIVYACWRNYRIDSAVRWNLRSRQMPDTPDRRDKMAAGVPFELLMKASGGGATSSAMSEGGGLGIHFAKISSLADSGGISLEAPIVREQLKEAGEDYDGDVLASSERWIHHQFEAVLGSDRANKNLFIRSLDPEYRSSMKKKFEKLEKDVLKIKADTDFLFDEIQIEQQQRKLESKKKRSIEEDSEKQYNEYVNTV